VPADIRLLSIAPYRFLPPSTGGHWAIAGLHEALGRQCEDVLISTQSNQPAKENSFRLYPILPDKASRYLPFAHFPEVKKIAQQTGCTHLLIEHPYMAPLAWRLSKSLKLPWYIRSHNIESERFRSLGKKWWPILRQYEQWAMRAANGIFFITPEEKEWALKNYGLSENRCHVAPFGTNLTAPPLRDNANAKLARNLGVSPDVPWLYFLGILDYAPNEEAVAFILNEIAPRLKAAGSEARIFIAGKNLNPALQAQIKATGGQVHYLGFVEDLSLFINACDVMLNPVLRGGGIKTKAVEALAYNKMVVSTQSGAEGLLPDVCAPNLLLAENGNWAAYFEQLRIALHSQPGIGAAFYAHYSWESIAGKVLDVMSASNEARRAAGMVAAAGLVEKGL